MQIREIKRLLFKELSGLATADDKYRIEEWLGESEENRTLYDRLHRATFLAKAMTDDNREQRQRVWDKITRDISPGRRRGLRRRAMRVAAAVAIPLVALGGLLTYRLLDGREPESTVTANLIRPGHPQVVVTLPGGEQMMFDDRTNVSTVGEGGALVVNEGRTVSITTQDLAFLPDQYTTFKIPSGGEYTVKLDDGTIVTMNSESELRAPARFGPDVRKVYFKGEGYFEVAKDAGRQFIVETDRAEISVLGTEFNIRSYSDEDYTAATLVEGSVSIRAGTDTRIEMVPDTQVRVSDNGNITIEAVDVYSYIAWKSGRIVFNNARTEDIMTVLRKWYNCDVHYADDALKERRFTMDLLKYDDITEVLDLMSMVNIHYTIKGDDVFLKSN